MTNDNDTRKITVTEKVGATFGLTVQTCSMQDHLAEQVYVHITDCESHPITLDAWVGYESTGLMRVTKRQATDLIGLLAKAIGNTP
jgi:hypothetical protein